jgi:hypothetical protein
MALFGPSLVSAKMSHYWLCCVLSTFLKTMVVKLVFQGNFLRYYYFQQSDRLSLNESENRFYVGIQKYTLVFCDGNCIYARDAKGRGVVCVLVKKCVVIGAHDQQLLSGAARQVVEYMADYLALQGF